MLAVAVGAAGWFGFSRPAAVPAVTTAAGEAESPATPDLTVHVSGAVVAPGLVSVGPQARVADVISAAGGARPDADLRALNLAAPVRDGEQVAVPSIEDGATVAVRALDGDGTVRVNLADATQLETLPGVGPVLAARIVAYREEQGPFAEVEDLLDVSGIGEQKLAALRDFVAVP